MAGVKAKHIPQWIYIAGAWTCSGASANYEAPEPGQFPFGLALSSYRFREGILNVTVRLEDRKSSGRLVFGYDSSSDRYFSIGIGGGNVAYVLYEFAPGFGWHPLALKGSSFNIPTNVDIDLQLNLCGQRVQLSVDRVLVIEQNLPHPLAGDQAGLFAWESCPVVFREFHVGGSPADVFVTNSVTEAPPDETPLSDDHMQKGGPRFLSDLAHWEKLRVLGEGGQGKVFLVRTPARVAARNQAKAQIRPCIGNIGGYEGEPSDDVVQKLLGAITEYSRPDAPDELGALKQFKIADDDEPKEAETLGRLRVEIKALQKINHPAVLRLLHSNVDERFIVTTFHPNGTLDRHLDRYKGKPLEALSAFRPLVEALAAIHHEYGAVHRDIKTENIFVACDGHLILGDFGIVFFSDGSRQTTTFERVGSHYWMPPWAYRNERLAIDQVSPSLDIFPLAKVLWSMISGRNGFPFWEWNRDENNLETMFPDSTIMPLINRNIISRCIVREEKDCSIRFAPALLQEIDTLIDQGRCVAQRIDGENTWPCRICGRGRYHPASAPIGTRFGPPAVSAQFSGGTVSDRESFSISVCDHCGHAELFKS